MKSQLRSVAIATRTTCALAGLLAIVLGTTEAAWPAAPEVRQVAPGTFGMPAGDDTVFSIDSAIGPIEYRSARGVRFGNTGLNVGGFSTLEVAREEGEPVEVALDSINMLVLFEPIHSFRTFAELEIGDLFLYEQGGGTDSDPSLSIERLYGELSLDDPINIRFGKFQTPIGRWNLVPAEPFVWTVTTDRKSVV